MGVVNAAPLYWALQLAGWGFYFYAQASGEVIFASASWRQATTLWGSVCVAGMALTHGLRLLARHRGWLALPPAALLGRMALGTLAISVASYLLLHHLSQAVYGTPVSPLAGSFYERLPPGAQLRNQFILVLAVHAAWVALYLAFAVQRRRYQAEVRQAQLGEALQAAELRLLKSQLNPHFLFNALNGLRSLIADEPGRARDAVTHLARTLRYTLASGDEDLVSLARELEMVDDYLALEGMRLAERLTVESDIDPDVRQARLPAMLLQTLVENAIKHGIAALPDGGRLRLTATADAGQLRITVMNPRPADAVAAAGDGVGLRNASERLRLLFGARASLHLDLSTPGIALAEVRLPL
jgi:hypothetical protein